MPLKSFLISLIFIMVVLKQAQSLGTLRVMSFNIWISGRLVEDGLYKVAKHIKIINPDIVAIQELDTPRILKNLTSKLGNDWKGFHGSGLYNDVGILTRHKFVESNQMETLRNITTSDFDRIRFETNLTNITRNSAISTSIELDSGLIVNFWNLHLDYHSMGPEAAQNKLVTMPEQIMAGEDTGTPDCRYGEVREVMDHPVFKDSLNKADESPVILCGDFNSPSHLDWIEKNKHLHGGWVFPWPSSKMLIEESKMIDSFREIHPDPITEPGNSWSTVQKHAGPEWGYTIPEPQDRLDYIYYRGSKIEPIDSFMYAGNQPLTPIPNQRMNDYPSDHYAIVTDFAIKSTGVE